jgi:class 3 adenylate cyclase/tetratricopeptide (TPR) repeat protein
VGAESCPRCGAGLPLDARFCAQCGLDLAAAAAAPRDERRVITALFADLAGSTQLGERLDPEDFRDLTGGALARMGAAIEELGGTVRGTAGDGVLGLFGAPTAHEDDAERAVVAGLRLVEGMREYGLEAVERWGEADLHVRVGIETGLAVLGEVRAGTQVQYDASGDCLNTAARLEGAADHDGVLVGPATHRLISQAFDWGEPRPLDLKGKAEPVLARHAVARRGDVPQRRPDPVSRLVGRDRELTVADGILADVAARRPRTLLLTGPAGIGKTRFMRELRTRFEAVGDDSTEPTWLEGACLSYGEDEPYLPFRQVLRQALGDGGVPPMLGVVLGLAPDTDDAARVAGLSPESLHQAVIDAVVELVTGLAAHGPVAIALDDLHWADAATLRLAEGLIDGLPEDVPVLVVLAMRSEPDRPSWALRENALERRPDTSTEVALTPLDRDAERGLVSDLVGVGTLPDDLESHLLHRAEGNPFFLGELLRSLLDAGAIVRSDGRWRFDHEVTVDLPDTVERVVLARIDRLSSQHRDLLSSAAVIGREFDLPLLGRVADVELTPQSLSGLIRLGLFEESAGAHYRFSHPLIQETAYQSMLRRGRRELHARAAVAIEELADAGSDQHLAALARHHGAAGHVADAVRYHRLAAVAFQRVMALEEAMNQLDSAIDAAASLDAESVATQLPELHLLRGRARGWSGDYPGATADVSQALAGAQAVGDDDAEMQALTDLGWLTRAHGYEEAIRLHEQALRRAEELDDPATQVTALGRMSMIRLNRLQLDDGLALAHRALTIARATGQDPLLGASLDCLKFAALQLGDLALLERAVAEIIDVHERTGDLFLLQWAYNEGATVPLSRGDLGQARERLDTAREINGRFVSDRVARAMVLEAGSWIDRAAGDPRAAAAAVHEAIATIGRQTTPEWSAWLQASMGSHLVEAGQAQDAVAVLESALEQADAIKSPNRAFRAASHLALARQQVGDDAGARTALTRAQAVLASITAPPGDVFLDGYHSYLAVAQTCRLLGDADAATEVLLPLLAAARTHGWRDAERAASALLTDLG